VILIVGLMLLSAFERPFFSLAVIASYMSILLVHESGHLLAAHHYRCHVRSIDLYPVYGITWYEEPPYQYERAVIAWGGVLAQLVVAVPIITCVELFGFTHWDAVNAALVFLGHISLTIALFNLIPVAPLDGSKAWSIFPAAIERARMSRHRQTTRYRSPR
jgi:Zn-dependent protease